ncbi:hypothetical protein RB195_021980 [Necator americanus]|uniref:Endonuclease/exonuclease/phosphatase domain-containing protein n=1 Tax=Necator americanus TaxID=51031 RepID=A0ABR1EDH8_NECAM
MRTLKLQLDYVLARNIPQSNIRKSRAVWDVAFDSDHRPVLLNFKTSNGNQGGRTTDRTRREFRYLGCTLKNNGSYENDIQQRCTKTTSAFTSLTKCLWSTPITNEVKLRVYLSAVRPIMMYGSDTWAAPSTVMERLVCTERKLLGRLLGYF